MSWHCPSWASNVSTAPAYDFDDGNTATAIYRNNRCNSFSRAATSYVTALDEVLDTTLDDDVDAYCTEHHRDAEWEADYDVLADLEVAGFYPCIDCETVYHTEEALSAHNLDVHDDEEYEEDHPDILDINGNVIGTWNWITMSYRRPVMTIHKSWLP